jgi:Flp pilus assembly secretin CpaC
MTKRGTARALLMAGIAAGTLACASLPTDAAPARKGVAVAAPRPGAQALREGRGGEAIAALSPLAAQRPRDSSGQTMLALAYQQMGEPENLELALAGYDLALKAEPGQFWAAAMAGRAAFDRGRYEEAADRFAAAVMSRPEDGRALLALARASWMAGDVGMAAAAASRSAALTPEGPERVAALRLAAMANAAAGEGGEAKLQLASLQSLDPVGAGEVRRRMAALERTAAVDFEGAPQDGFAAAGPAEIPNQISVDVAIVLAQNTHRDTIGMNLLDGLKLQYGVTSTDSSTHQPGPDSFQRVITEAIGIPQLTYSLNLFNRGGQYYQVVARPTLTAYRGEISEFFVGRTIKTAVGGVNVAQLEQIDIGIEMKVTPVEITADGARIRIETSRSFLSNDPAGTFAEALTTFRQRVAATAEIRFGETLVLSGLSESVDDSTFSRVPVLGKAPVIGSLFNERQKTSRRDSVLILVTPSLTTSLPGRAWNRPAAVARLAELWTQVIDPSSNGVDVAARLRRARLFSRMAPGDSPLSWPDAKGDAGEMLGDLLVP